MTETLGYQLVEKLGVVEIRRYSKFLMMATFDSGSLASAGNRSFSRLANFIFGGNDLGQKIAMTAPVTQRRVDSGYETGFVMPAAISLDQLPTTRDGSLQFREEPGGLYGAITFSGLADDRLFESRTKRLLKILQDSGKEVSGEPIYARYNGPWTPFFLRRNEVLVPIAQ